MKAKIRSLLRKLNLHSNRCIICDEKLDPPYTVCGKCSNSC